MDAATKRIADGLEKAMQAEHEGRHFYLMAAKSTQDAKGRETFETLAEEEFEHFNFLRGQHKAVVETGQIDETLKLGDPKAFTGDHPIFSAEIKSRIGEAHYEMTALSIGVQLEMSAVQFYRGEAEAVADPGIKAFYEKLADWEKGHLNALQGQIDALKEDYWHEARFEPF